MTCDLTKVHEAGLKILCKMDRIYRKYKTKCMPGSGVLLGATHHHGFIPRGDDMDIVFTRKNYEAFLKVVKRELPEGMSFLDCADIEGGRVLYDFVSRIVYDNSRVYEDTSMMQYYNRKLNRLWVNLFMIEELPAEKVAETWALLPHKVIYSLTVGYRFKLDYSKYSSFYKLAVGGLAAVGRLVPIRWLFRLKDMVAKRDGGGRNSRLYHSNHAPDYHYATLDKEWREDTIDMEFGGVELMAPAGCRQILALVYGDYMELSPEDKRAPARSNMEIQTFG